MCTFVLSPQLTVQCHDKVEPPHIMSRGSATTDHQFGYFMPSGSNRVFSYEWSTEEWKLLPPYPLYKNSALVIIEGSLTAVGGWDRSLQRTNKLYTLQERKWVEEYPPMNTARSHTAAVSTSDYIVVIGGDDGLGDRWTSTVELFHTKSRIWCELTDLPQPLAYPSATLCGHQLYVIDEDDNGYSCSLPALPSSAQPTISESVQELSWTALPRLPVIYSTAATLCGQFVIVGGKRDGSLVNTIHQQIVGQWVEIGSMARERRRCLVVSPSPDKMLIVGGVGAQKSVEECTLSGSS